MRKNAWRFILAALCLALSGVAAGKPRPTVEVTGNVYDIDFGPARTQVLVRPSTGEAQYFMASSMLQDVFQAAFISGRTVRLKHRDRNVVEVTLIQTPTDRPCSESGCVQEVLCTDSECSASIRGQSARVKTKNRRALGILLTAISDGRKVEELMVDQYRVITRVKVNKP